MTQHPAHPGRECRVKGLVKPAVAHAMARCGAKFVDMRPLHDSKGDYSPKTPRSVVDRTRGVQRLRYSFPQIWNPNRIPFSTATDAHKQAKELIGVEGFSAVFALAVLPALGSLLGSVPSELIPSRSGA